MKLIATSVLLALLLPIEMRAQLQLVPDSRLQCVFAGPARNISLLWHNHADTNAEAALQARVSQLTSATATTISEAPWKQLRVLPGQTIVEAATIDFPSVNAATRFLVQWIENTNRVLASTQVLVYPTNLLAELQPLAGHEDGALGIFDPLNQLKPLLRSAKVDFIDLGNVELENYRGRLAIIGPFESKMKMETQLAKKIKTIAENGVAVVWLQPSVEESLFSEEWPVPSFYSVHENQTAVIIAQAHMVANLSENPRSQLNLIAFCKMALCRQPLALPSSRTQPRF